MVYNDGYIAYREHKLMIVLLGGLKTESWSEIPLLNSGFESIRDIKCRIQMLPENDLIQDNELWILIIRFSRYGFRQSRIYSNDRVRINIISIRIDGRKSVTQSISGRDHSSPIESETEKQFTSFKSRLEQLIKPKITLLMKLIEK